MKNAGQRFLFTNNINNKQDYSLLTIYMPPTVFIVGNQGYIGSFLCSSLQSCEIKTPNKKQRGKECDVYSADVVIYLGGIVGHQRCEIQSEREVFDANVGDIMHMAAKMKPGALLIYSSTAALYEGHGTSEPKETAMLHEQLFDKYMMSMFCATRYCSVKFESKVLIWVEVSSRFTI